MSKRTVLLTVATLAIGGAGVASMMRHQPILPDAPPARSWVILDKEGHETGRYYTLPPFRNILNEPNASQILYGKRLLSDTARLLPDNVGDGLNCTSCHLADGRLDQGHNFINTINTYPTYKSRSNSIVDIVQRINGCFRRSMNGNPLDPQGEPMQAMIAYMTWLKQDIPKGSRVAMALSGPINESQIPDPAHGKEIYASHCALCHGEQGEGLRDQFGDFIFPPLWGNESFNIGAGMARLYNATAFARHVMPPAMTLQMPIGQGGILNDQDAMDVAEYFTHMPRPDFPDKNRDWPGVPKPRDARY